MLLGGDAAREVWSPLAIFAAEEDDIFPETKRRETEDVLKEVGATWSCTTFSGTEHGFRYVIPSLRNRKGGLMLTFSFFSVRGDLSDKAVRFASHSAFQGAVAWFDEYLGSFRRRVKEG